VDRPVALRADGWHMGTHVARSPDLWRTGTRATAPAAMRSASAPASLCARGYTSGVLLALVAI